VANYYTSYSFIVEDNPDAIKELKKLLDAANAIYEGAWGDVDDEELVALTDRYGEDMRYSRADWQGGGEDDGSIWFHEEESGDIDGLIEVLKRWTYEHHRDKPIGFEWANTCSKPRLDAFGGGAAVVLNGFAKFMNTSTWVVEAAKMLADGSDVA